MLPLEVMELHFDEVSDLIGGAPWQVVKDRILQSAAPGRERILSALDKVFTSPLQWIYRHDKTGRFALEVLHLKVSLFRQICRGLREYHAKCREPHLDVSPTQVMVDVVPAEFLSIER